MVWTNIFAFLIAMAASVASSATGSFRPNLELLFSDLNLFTDACVFSAASALGLIVLLNTIASFVRHLLLPVRFLPDLHRLTRACRARSRRRSS